MAGKKILIVGASGLVGTAAVPTSPDAPTIRIFFPAMNCSVS